MLPLLELVPARAVALSALDGEADLPAALAASLFVNARAVASCATLRDRGLVLSRAIALAARLAEAFARPLAAEARFGFTNKCARAAATSARLPMYAIPPASTTLQRACSGSIASEACPVIVDGADQVLPDHRRPVLVALRASRVALAEEEFVQSHGFALIADD